MASTTFTSGTVFTSAWANDVNDVVYDHTVDARLSPYGAVGNNIADDTAALQAAINAAALSKVDLIIPAGNYRITSGLTCGTPIKIRGAGTASTIIKYDATSGVAFTFTNGAGNYDDGFSLSDIKFEQVNARSGSSIGLQLNGIVWPISKVTDVQVVGFGSHGVVVNDCINATFERVRSAGNGGRGWSIDKSNGVTLFRCSAESNRSDGFYWTTSGTSGERFGPSMKECHAEENAGNCVYANTTLGLRIDGGWYQVAGLSPTTYLPSAESFAAFALDQTMGAILDNVVVTTGGTTTNLIGINLSGALFGAVTTCYLSGFATGRDLIANSSSGRVFILANTGSGLQNKLSTTDSSSTGNVYGDHFGSGSNYGMEWTANYTAFRLADGTEKVRVDTNGLNLVNHTTGTSSPSAGGAGALPATPTGYVTVMINGTARKVAYY